jgi:hypothetical protein
MYDGESGSAATDQFALGVTLYRLFTGAYPWGEVDPSDAPRFDRAPVSLGRRRPGHARLAGGRRHARRRRRSG